MSGMKNLANAIANEPGFVSKTSGLMSKKEAAEYVPQGDAKAASRKTPGLNKGKKY